MSLKGNGKNVSMQMKTATLLPLRNNKRLHFNARKYACTFLQLWRDGRRLRKVLVSID